MADIKGLSFDLRHPAANKIENNNASCATRAIAIAQASTFPRSSHRLALRNCGPMRMHLRTSGKPLFILLLALMLIAPVAPAAHAAAGSRASEFKLTNGLTIIVVPDNRAPVVTHMVWIRAGAADEPPGTSGIAHFL
jgi:hypothetical protein